MAESPRPQTFSPAAVLARLLAHRFDAEMMALYERERARGFLLCPVGRHGIHLPNDLSLACSLCGTTALQVAELQPARWA